MAAFCSDSTIRFSSKVTQEIVFFWYLRPMFTCYLGRNLQIWKPAHNTLFVTVQLLRMSSLVLCPWYEVFLWKNWLFRKASGKILALIRKDGLLLPLLQKLCFKTWKPGKSIKDFKTRKNYSSLDFEAQ